MSYHRQIHKHFVWFCFPFQHAINSAIHVDPGKGAFNPPPLPAILLFSAFPYGKLGCVIVSWNKYRNNMASSAFFAQWIAVKALVSAHALGSSLFSVDCDAINCFDDQSLIMVVGFTNLVWNGVPFGIADEGSFNAVNPVFSWISYLFFAPLFDLTTEPST